MKHFFFDMDGTLTRSRSQISIGMSKLLKFFLSTGVDIIVVSGADKERIYTQLGSVAEEMHILAQNGNHAIAAAGIGLWKNEMNWIQKYNVFDLINQLTSGDGVPDMVQDRGSQISYSLIGHSKPIEVKEKFDPKRIKRKALIHDDRELFDLLTGGVKYAIGGTTCIDFYTDTKGENVQRYIDHYGWNKKECIYVGDAMYEGGNDYSVNGIIECREVSGPDECEKLIKEFVDKYTPNNVPDEEDDDEDEDM